MELNSPTMRSTPPESLLSDDSDSDDRPQVSHAVNAPVQGVKLKQAVMRLLALLCAMSLSVGSHYGSYFLGPLKSRLSREIGTNNTEFSILIAAFNLNSTWTPLVAGVIAGKIGTAFSSIIATSLIFAGQMILLLGDVYGNIPLMATGLFIFGLGISPLAVVQETIVIRFFKSHGLGISLAIGLIAGKGASFVSARTSYPLSEAYGPHAPFFVSTLLAFFSFAVNLIYLSSSAWLAQGAGIEFEAAEVGYEDRLKLPGTLTEEEALRSVVQKRAVRFSDIAKLGDIFWAYIFINVLCGAIWSPFTHLAANIIQTRYDLDEADAGAKASLLLAGSLFLYPICGFLTDRLKKGPIVHILFILSSALTLFCYIWLVLPPSLTRTPMPAILSFGAGHGFSTLLLVIIAPRLVPLYYVSTALGAHKSLEQTGSTISQTFAGLLLDKIRSTEPTPGDKSLQTLLNSFLLINIIQFIGTIFLWKLDSHLKLHAKRRVSVAEYQPVPASPLDNPQSPDGPLKPDDDESAIDEGEEQQGSSRAREAERSSFSRAYQGSWSNRVRPLLTSPVSQRSSRYLLAPAEIVTPPRRRGLPGLARTKAERTRGKIFTVISAILIVFAWVLFMSTAWLKIRAKKDRGNSING